MQAVESNENKVEKIGNFPSIAMCLAGGEAYERWLNDHKEQAQFNRVGNLVAKIYLAMVCEVSSPDQDDQVNCKPR